MINCRALKITSQYINQRSFPVGIVFVTLNVVRIKT